jgi:conjugative transfer signal peptidase TraF
MFISAGGGDMNDITAIPGRIGKVCTKTPKSGALQGIKLLESTREHNSPACSLRRKKVLIIMAGTLLAFFVSLTLSAKTGTCYYINLSHSVPLGLYQVIPPDNLKTGDLVVFEPPQGARFLIHQRHWLPNGWPLIKYVGALAGDSYSVIEGSFFINSKYVGSVYERDSQGKALPSRGGRFIVERNTFLPVSTHINNSFDGRYFGSVPLSSIKGKLSPIWTF